MIRLFIPAGLDRIGDGQFKGRALSAVRGAPSKSTAVDCDPHAPIELEWADGTCVIRPATDLPNAASGSVDLARSRRLGAGRDGVFAALVRVVIHSPIADTGLHAVLVAFDNARLGRVEGATTLRAKPRLWAIGPRGELTTKYHPVAPKEAILVLLHGTFSNTREAYADLFKSAAWSGIWQRYANPQLDETQPNDASQARTFGFDHRTVSEDPFENVDQLIDALPDGAVVDVVSHSRGGLVLDVFAAAVAEHTPREYETRLGLGAELLELDRRFASLRKKASDKSLSLRRSVRVAAPARGTTLASARLDTWLNVVLNVVGLSTNLAGPMKELYDGLKTLLIEVVKKRANDEVASGLAVMVPDSPLVRWLPARTADDALTVIAGDASRPDFLGRLRTILVDLFFMTKNDLVVDTAAMIGGARRSQSTVLAFRDTPNAPLHHLA